MASSNKNTIGWKGFINIHFSPELNDMISSEEQTGDLWSMEAMHLRMAELARLGTLSFSYTLRNTYNIILHIPADREDKLAGYKLSVWDSTLQLGVARLFIGYGAGLFLAELQRKEEQELPF